MNNEQRLYPTPPHTDVSFFFRDADARKNWRLVCESLLERSAPTGELDVVREPAAPVFQLLSDLPIQVNDIDVGGEALLATWRDVTLGMRPDLWPIRVGFTYEENRRGVVQQYTLTEIESPIGSHPIAITLGTEVLETTGFERMKSRERARVLKGAAFALDLFRRVCGTGEVLYGAILNDRRFPTPQGLARQRLGIEPELFVSDQLSRAKPRLAERLAALFPEAVVENWSTGTYFSRWRRSTRSSIPSRLLQMPPAGQDESLLRRSSQAAGQGKADASRQRGLAPHPYRLASGPGCTARAPIGKIRPSDRSLVAWGST